MALAPNGRIVICAALVSSLALSCTHTQHQTATVNEANIRAVASDKAELMRVRAQADRSAGVVQLTGKDIVVGQKVFPKRTPADPVPFIDATTGEVYVYGTQVDGTGFSYLRYGNKDDLLRGATPELISRDVYLPNGEVMSGAEAVWDTYRLAYSVLAQAFPKEALEKAYRQYGITPGSDLFYGGIALQENGTLGRWTTDNWRRRVHAIVQMEGRLQILQTPVFNTIPKGASEKDYPGFGHLPFLPGDYIGHAYGPNFKLVRNGRKLELWIISEEVTRRVNETGTPAEVTEIVARRMLTPFKADSKKVLLVSVNDDKGKPHHDSDRGKEMAHTKLIEGFRPTSVTTEGIRIGKRAIMSQGRVSIVNDFAVGKKEYFFLTGSPGNFAGDDYDAIVAVREDTPIGPYEILESDDGKSWKRFLTEIKQTYRLSWAGRGAFIQDESGEWWLLFHAVDKDLKPDGSYSGVIPANTPEYHRNLYAVPVEFYINLRGDPDMRVLL